MQRTHAWGITAALALAITAGEAHAQSAHHELVAQGHESAPSMSADRADGATLIATVRSTPAGPKLTFERKNPDGTIRWTHPTPHAGFARHVVALRDGAWLVVAQAELGVASPDQSGFVTVFEDDGRVRWTIAPRGPWTSFEPAVAPNGRIFVHGMFFRGSIQLPGAPRWSSRRRFTGFLAELDAQSGDARWAHTTVTGDEGAQLAVTTDSTLVVSTHRARKRAGQQLVIDTFSDAGAPLAHRTIALQGSSYPRAIRPLANGAFAIVTSTEATGTDPAMRLGLFARNNAEPIWVALPNHAMLVATHDAAAPLEVLAPGAYAGAYEEHRALVRGARVITIDPSRAERTREQWIGTGRSIALGSLHASRAHSLNISLADRDAAQRFTVHCARAESLATQTDPGAYTLHAHRATLASAAAQPLML
jgi:hypothetical protein